MYGSNDDRQFLLALQRHLAWQGEKLMQMERMLEQLQREIAVLSQRSTTHIERIDYKFDQLKVEKLEGTLNIGLTPDGNGWIEEMSTDGDVKEDIQVGGEPDGGTAADGKKGQVFNVPVSLMDATKEPTEADGGGNGVKPPSASAGAAGIIGNAGGSVAQGSGLGGGAGINAGPGAGIGSGADADAGGGAVGGTGVGIGGGAGGGTGAGVGGGAGVGIGGGAGVGVGVGIGGGTGTGVGAETGVPPFLRGVYSIVHEQVYVFLRKEVPSKIMELERKYGHPLDYGYRQILVDDVRKQTERRMLEYLEMASNGAGKGKSYGKPGTDERRQGASQNAGGKLRADGKQKVEGTPQTGGSSNSIIVDRELAKKIMDQIRKDVYAGLELYFQQFGGEQK